LCLLGSSFWGCGGRDEIALDYELSGIDLSQVVRVETYIAVAPSDKRNFFADSPYRSVATGVGYEVRDFDGSGQRKVLITHDNTLGFVFTKNFTFTLLPPSGETPPPLVVTARAVGAAAMLGRTKDLPAAFAINASVKVALSDQRCNGISCATDQACCNDACTNTKSDPLHCGGCGKACAPLGDGCQGGSCLCAGGSACTGSQVCCAMVGCIDLMSDPFNCGACGKSCNPGESCSGGVCQCNGGASCGTNGLCCAMTGCSTTGSCACGSSTCAAPNTCCDTTAGTCVNLMTDNNNCGACKKMCPSGLLCDNGACKCNGQICSQADTCCPAGCANLMSSTANCGSCGHACAANEVCSSGICQCGTTTCTTGQSCCGTACKTLDSDTMNCGACGHACNAGEQCVTGHCVCPGTNPPRACTGSETCCGAAGGTSGGGCFDLSSNHDHCGQCTRACQSTEMCTGGNCMQSACNPPCSTANGNVCNPQTLTCVCGNSTGCTGTNFCCGGVCVDRSTDVRNCGSCGTDVRPNLCCNSVSTPHDAINCTACGAGCSLGQLCCSGANGGFACVAGDASPNCGACGVTCGGALTDGFKTGLGTCCQGCNGGPGFCSMGSCPLCPAGGPG
jgi:hypothetical protein